MLQTIPMAVTTIVSGTTRLWRIATGVYAMQVQKQEMCSGLFGVVPVLLYVFFYRVWNNILDRLLVFNEVADVGRRDV